MEYSIINGLSVVTINLVSIYFGGAIGDYYEDKRPGMKSYIIVIGLLCSFPFLLVAFIISTNFWLSVWMFMFSFLFSEIWFGNTMSMMQNIFPSQLIGTAISVLLFSAGISGALTNLSLGLLSDVYDTSHNPRAAGYLMMIIVIISYLGSIPLFILAGWYYQKYLTSKKKSEE